MTMDPGLRTISSLTTAFVAVDLFEGFRLQPIGVQLLVTVVVTRLLIIRRF